MCLDKALPESVSLSHRDYEWIQPLDHEHVPFRCRKCHAIGNIFRDCPLNVKANAPAPSDSLTHDGFTKAPTRKQANKKPTTGKKPLQNNTSDPAVRNSFEILAQSTEELNPSSIPNSALPSSSTQPTPSSPSSEPPPSKDTLVNPTESKEKQVEKDIEMEVDGSSVPLQGSDIPLEENNQVQRMEEEPESIDLNGLDILEL